MLPCLSANLQWGTADAEIKYPTVENPDLKRSLFKLGVDQKKSEIRAISPPDPQSSVLEPILFVLYTKPLDDIFDRHSVCHHSFADDTQMQNSSSLDQLDTTISAMQECF